MDDTLKRLLKAEKQAREITSNAKNQADELVQKAIHEAQLREEHFRAGIPELRASFIEKAEQRAALAVKELERRFDEHIARLRAAAQLNEESALDSAFDYLLHPQDRHSP